MGDSQLYQICPQCDGDGIWGGKPEHSCSTCNGSGFLHKFKAELNSNQFRTHQIVEATKTSEYTTLSAANKDAYKMIISCGIVDLSEGTAIRTKLWNMFDENSETRAALITLLGE